MSQGVSGTEEGDNEDTQPDTKPCHPIPPLFFPLSINNQPVAGSDCLPQSVGYEGIQSRAWWMSIVRGKHFSFSFH